MSDIMYGSSLDSLFVLNEARSRRVSSFDRSGGNHDWLDIDPGETKEVADIRDEGIIRHIWSTVWVGVAGEPAESQHLRKLVLRMYWDGETGPSVEAPLGDFFGMGHGLTRNFVAAPWP